MKILQHSLQCSLLLISVFSQLATAEEFKLQLSSGLEIYCGSKNQCIAARSAYPGSMVVRR